jgi:hypothetical protein
MDTDSRIDLERSFYLFIKAVMIHQLIDKRKSISILGK